MKFLPSWTAREKWMLCIIILFAAVMAAGSKPFLVGVNSVSTSAQLYQKANQNYMNDHLEWAVAYLYAYIETYPPSYANNTQGHRDKVNSILKEMMETIKEDRILAKDVTEDVLNCKRYPCQAEAGGSYHMLFPSKMVKVCEEINGGGKCSFLSVGEYDRWNELGVRNDSISSVIVGDDVQVLLCAHNLQMQNECVLLTSTDINLTNNYRATGSSINNSVSTARVTYKASSGLVLPTAIPSTSLGQSQHPISTATQPVTKP